MRINISRAFPRFTAASAAVAAATVIAALMATATLPLPTVASEPARSAESYLSFETKIDGRCQNLSTGGKLQIVRNMHPTKEIRFRLIRYYIDVRQRGRATGLAGAAGEPVKLGCTLVGGRTQRWVVERAEFTIADKP